MIKVNDTMKMNICHSPTSRVHNGEEPFDSDWHSGPLVWHFLHSIFKVWSRKISSSSIVIAKVDVLPSRSSEGDLYERKQPRKDPWMDPDLVLKKELVFMPITNDDRLHYVLNLPPSNRWTIVASWRRRTLWWWRRSQRQPALSAVGGSSPADYFW